jgi:small subunit ribosomal protein S2
MSTNNKINKYKYYFKKKVNTISLNRLIKYKLFIGSTKLNKNILLNNFLLGKRKNVYIIDLEQTIFYLKKAIFFLKALELKKNEVLFIGIPNRITFLTKVIAKKTNQLYLNITTRPGIISNKDKFLNTINKNIFNSLSNRKKKLRRSKITKSVSILDLSTLLKNIFYLKYSPRVSFFLTLENSYSLSKELKIKNIPTIALVSNNQDISNINFPIPSNLSNKSICCLMNIVTNSINTKHN